MYRGFSTREQKPEKQCPLCLSPCYEDSDYTGTTRVVCPVCGVYRFGLGTELFFRSPPIQEGQLGYKLSHFLRSIAERAIGRRDNTFFPIYTGSDFEEVLSSRDPSVREKLQILLRYVAGLSQHPGDKVNFDLRTDYSVICAKNASEANFGIQSLADQGLIVVEKFLSGDAHCQLTSSGWNELERIEQSALDSQNGFIAMWFDRSQNEARESIRAAIKSAGYLPIRIDEVEHVNRIDDEIIAQIRRSRFVVADFTGQRNGVYFEAGFMLGLGRPVIWVCNKSDFANVHFDTRQYNTIVYEDGAELRSKVQFRIEAVLGKGPIPT